MAAPKIRKAIITTRYPTARDLAELLHVPERHVLQLAEELMHSQRAQGRRSTGSSRRTVPGVPAGRAKTNGPRKSKKRAGGAR